MSLPLGHPELTQALLAAGGGVAGQIEPPSPDDLLCYCWTGGTTGSGRCVAITHRMAAHEIVTYPPALGMPSPSHPSAELHPAAEKTDLAALSSDLHINSLFVFKT